jgi:hypothetical protein
MGNDGYSIRRNSQAINLTHGASATTASNTNVKLNGLLRQVNAMTPAAVDSSATATINIIDVDGITVYTKAALVVNTKTKDLLTTPIPLSGLYTVQVVFSASQTATDSITNVTLLVSNS